MTSAKSNFRKVFFDQSHRHVTPQSAIRVTVDYFNLLIGAAVIALVIGVPFVFYQKLGTGIIAAVTLALSMMARRLALQGKPELAMDLFGRVFVVIVMGYLTLSQRIGTAGLLVISFLPIYAIVCGFKTAVRFAAAFSLFAIVFNLAVLCGLEIPNLFQGKQTGDTFVFSLAMVIALLPLPTLFVELNASLEQAKRELAEREAVQAALTLSNQRLADFSASASDWFWETNPQHKVAFTSRIDKGEHDAFTEAMKLWEDGPASNKIWSPEWRRMQLAFQSQRPFRDIEVPVEFGAGNANHWLTFSGKPVIAASGEFQGYRGSASDVTERKRGELAIIRARDAAESANRTKSQFLANLSHEVRTPLNGILGMSSLLEMSELDAEQQSWLAELAGCGNQLHTMLGRMLDFAQLESGSATLSCDPFLLNECIESAMRDHAAAATAKGLVMQFDLAPVVPALLLGDGHRVRQLLSNLIDNAIRFTSNGSVSVRAGLASGAAPGAHVAIALEVQDTGIGIATELQETIFESFRQVDGSATRSVSGNGLGLPICRAIARLMHGRVDVDSAPGMGSTFRALLRFDLPESG